MAALSRLQKTSLQNLIHRHLLRPVPTSFAAAATIQPLNISPESQPSQCFDLHHLKSILAEHFSDKNKLSSNATEFVLNCNFPIGISALPSFDLSLMELRGSRSTSSKNSRDLEEDVEDDDEDDFDDEDSDAPMDFDDIDNEFGSESDSGDDDDDYGRGSRGGGSRGGAAYTA